MLLHDKLDLVSGKRALLESSCLLTFRKFISSCISAVLAAERCPPVATGDRCNSVDVMATKGGRRDNVDDYVIKWETPVLYSRTYGSKTRTRTFRADNNTLGYIKRSSASGGLSVCPHDRTKAAETSHRDSPSMSPGLLATHLILGPKVKGQGHTVTKFTYRVEGDRVAGVSLHSIEWQLPIAVVPAAIHHRVIADIIVGRVGGAWSHALQPLAIYSLWRSSIAGGCIMQTSEGG